MEHIVSIKETHRSDSWNDQATFKYFADALNFARLISSRDRLHRVVRADGGDNYINVYYRQGEELVAEGAE